jgi:hypothetical protein
MVRVGQNPTQDRQPTQSCFLRRTTPALSRDKAPVGHISIHSPHWLQTAITHSALPRLVIRIDDLARFISLYHAWEQMSSQRWQPMHNSSFVIRIFMICPLSHAVDKTKSSRLCGESTWKPESRDLAPLPSRPDGDLSGNLVTKDSSTPRNCQNKRTGVPLSRSLDNAGNEITAVSRHPIDYVLRYPCA